MNNFRRGILSLAALLVLCAAFSFLLVKNYVYPLGPLQISPLREFVVMDLCGAMAGMRRLSADIAWIQLLQYYGSPEEKLDKDTEYELSIATIRFLTGIKEKQQKESEVGGHEHGHMDAPYDIEAGVYPQLLSHCYRVVKLDPFFFHVYLFGSGALAWNLNRTDEAIQFLKYGIDTMEAYKMNVTKDVQQPYWQMNLYMAAIVYRNMGKTDEMVSLLEVAVKQPSCPNLVKTILASIYQKAGKDALALKLWIDVRESGDPTYSARSMEKITELRSRLGL